MLLYTLHFASLLLSPATPPDALIGGKAAGVPVRVIRVNLDAGASLAMHYRGKTLASPGRHLTNLLVVYMGK